MDSVTLTQAEYQDLVDARDHAIAMREVVTGSMETLTEAEVDAYLAAPSPLAFWRKRRGLSQVALAAQAGITQPYLAQAEHGRRNVSASKLGRLARALGVRMEDLLLEDQTLPT